MHRAYTAESIWNLVERIRRARNGVAITTTSSSGSGETDDDYRQTRDLVEEIHLITHLFFATHRGAILPAAEMPDTNR